AAFHRPDVVVRDLREVRVEAAGGEIRLYVG
ncbi:HAD family hydrolase, partial [Streptomyces sp. W16]|nr:HAD family hydrolase [Streptomyces sp. W16]